jgi:hypothetical protein
MDEARDDRRLLRRMRVVLIPAIAATAILATGPVSAVASCETNANGIANSHDGRAAGAATTACAPAWGKPASHDTGRKTG